MGDLDFPVLFEMGCLLLGGAWIVSGLRLSAGGGCREGEASRKFQSQGFCADREVSEEVSALGSLLTKNYWGKNTEGSQILGQDERKLRRVRKEKGKGRWEAQHPSRVGGKGLASLGY